MVGFKFKLYHAQAKFNRQEFDDIFFVQKTEFDILWKLSL